MTLFSAQGLGELAYCAPGLAPSLCSLKLEFYRRDDGEDPLVVAPEDFAFIGALAALRSLDLTGLPLPAPPAWLMALTALTHFQSNAISFSAGDVPALARLPALRHLGLGAWSGDGLQDAPAVFCPQVTSLYVGDLSRAHLPSLLASFPCVVEAVLLGHESDEDVPGHPPPP